MGRVQEGNNCFQTGARQQSTLYSEERADSFRHTCFQSSGNQASEVSLNGKHELKQVASPIQGQGWRQERRQVSFIDRQMSPGTSAAVAA